MKMSAGGKQREITGQKEAVEQNQTTTAFFRPTKPSIQTKAVGGEKCTKDGVEEDVYWGKER